MQVYKAALARGDDLHITEHHRHIGPVVVDLDFRFELPASNSLSAAATALTLNLEENQRDRVKDASSPPAPTAGGHMYREEHVDRVVDVYCRQVAAFCRLPPHGFDVYVTEKPGGWTPFKGLIKDGLHLVMPSIVTRPAVQLLMRRAALPELAEALSDLALVNRIDDVVDEAVIERNNWMMYGSKKPQGEAYVVTRRYRCCSTDCGSGVTVCRMPLEEQADNQTCSTATAAAADGCAPAESCSRYVELLSIRNKHDETEVLPGRIEDVAAFVASQEEARKRREAVQAVVMDGLPGAASRQNVCPDIDSVIRLVKILDPERASNYNNWVRVGWCLRNIDHRLLEAWVDFSRQSPKYLDGECPRLWNIMRVGGLGMGTLHMWAMHDAPERYRELMRSDLRDLILRSINATHHDVAQVVHHLFQYQYVCSSMRNRTWFEFRDHRWHECDCAVSLRRRISTDVFKEYNAIAMSMQQRAILSADEGEQKRLVEVCQRINNVALRLKTTAFKENVLKECAELFYRDGFESRLDSDVNLLGFDNGVYDLERGEFREGRPEDYVSFSTGNVYLPFRDDHPHAASLLRFWEQVLPAKDIRDYVLKSLASCLSGSIRQERFNIWTGTGCHAKGTRILMWDGTERVVEDIHVGDMLMGDDNTARHVRRLCRGRSRMWRVVPAHGGEPFIVNEDHVLCLRLCWDTPTVTHVIDENGDAGTWRVLWYERDAAQVAVMHTALFQTRLDAERHVARQATCNPNAIGNGDVVDITVRSYLACCQHLNQLGITACLYRPGVVYFPEPAALPLHPYALGVWLGLSSGCRGVGHDAREAVMQRVAQLLECPGADPAATLQCLEQQIAGCRALAADNDQTKRTIPQAYLANTKTARLQLLAGLLDTCGHVGPGAHCDILFRARDCDDLVGTVIRLARSLGFACDNKQPRTRSCSCGVSLRGTGLEEIPVVTAKPALDHTAGRCEATAGMDAGRHRHRHMAFSLEQVADDDFYGFELDGNHRYLMADFIVTHNSNGKSLSVSLFEKALGPQYCCKLPVSLLTQKRVASSSATPEIARARGRRFAVLQEPSDEEKLNVGLLKELSGGDTIQTRELFRSPVEWRPQFHLFLLCNSLPSAPSDDGGTWRRIRVVEFASKFVDAPKAANEFHVDPDLPAKLDSWKELFIAFLIDRVYPQYVRDALIEPDAVMRCTREYQRANDHMADFVDSCIVKTAGATLGLDDAFVELKDWSRRDAVPVKPRKNDLKSYLDRVVGRGVAQHGQHTYRGVRIKDRFDGGQSADGGDGDDAGM